MNDKEEKELATTEFYVRVGNSGCFKRTDLPAKALQEIEKLRIALEELEKDFLLE